MAERKQPEVIIGPELQARITGLSPAMVALINALAEKLLAEYLNELRAKSAETSGKPVL